MKKIIKIAFLTLSGTLLLTGCNKSIKRAEAKNILTSIISAHVNDEVKVSNLDMKLSTHDLGSLGENGHDIIHSEKEFAFELEQVGDVFTKTWQYYDFDKKVFIEAKDSNDDGTGKKAEEKKTYTSTKDDDNAIWASKEFDKTIKSLIKESQTVAEELLGQINVFDKGVGVSMKNETYYSSGKTSLVTDLSFDVFSQTKIHHYYDVGFDNALLYKANTLSNDNTLNCTCYYGNDVSFDYPDLTGFELDE